YFASTVARLLSRLRPRLHSTLCPYTTLFRSAVTVVGREDLHRPLHFGATGHREVRVARIEAQVRVVEGHDSAFRACCWTARPALSSSPASAVAWSGVSTRTSPAGNRRATRSPSTSTVSC